jgi:hypothetical protein
MIVGRTRSASRDELAIPTIVLTSWSKERSDRNFLPGAEFSHVSGLRVMGWKSA